MWRRGLQRPLPRHALASALAALLEFGNDEGVADEEDIVQEAFWHFFFGVRNGKFSELNDGDDVWQVLVMLARRRAVEAVRYENAARRCAPKVAPPCETTDPVSNVSQILPPERTAEIRDELAFRLRGFGGARLRRIVYMKMLGYTHVEIAERFGCAVRTIERKMALIRRIWLDSN